MRPETAAALQRINAAFYEGRAAEFSATREKPWSAWKRLAEIVEELGNDGPWSVLDLGCGNGRLGRFLAARWGDRLDTLGVDASEPMLEIARAMSPDGRFLRRDLVREGLPDELPGEPYDLACAFGLLHHLPGLASRAALLAAAADRLAPGGLLAASFWQFGAHERFRRRMVSWQTYNRSASEPIDTDDLEPGDVLLAWGEAPTTPGRTPPVRYCHWAPPEEADRLLAGLPLEPVASFLADGKAGDLNLYRLMRRA
jgi:SAM-dependent methyltransferase